MMASRIFPIINILLLTVAVYFCVDGFYTTINAKLDFIDMPSVSDTKKISGNSITNKPLSYYNINQTRNIFNLANSTTTTKQVIREPDNLDNLRETKLNLKLWGTIIGKRELSYAVIEDTKAREQRLYTINDTIQEAVMIERILKDKIILLINGNKQETLSMEQLRSDSKRKSGYDRSSSRSRKKSAGSQHFNIKRSVIDNSMQNINELMKQVKIRPHFKNGKPDGIIMNRIDPKSVFKKMGLRNGDILMGIDGAQIESVDDALKFYSTLRESSNINLQIKRRGKTKTIEYTIN